MLVRRKPVEGKSHTALNKAISDLEERFRVHSTETSRLYLISAIPSQLQSKGLPRGEESTGHLYGSNLRVGSDKYLASQQSIKVAISSICNYLNNPRAKKIECPPGISATLFVLDAALTACAHGRLSPRELATGLKDLAYFFSATLATIVSYFSAEVTQGIWKPAYMNGTDWPSPAANLSMVEQQIKKIIAATGVDVPSLPVGGNSPTTLSLPLAAFVSLTITYKFDKASERFLVLIGPALNALASACPWPCMPIVASFNGGVGALLGHGFCSHLSGGISPVAPGILYLRVFRSVRDAIMFLTEEIVSLLVLSVRDIASSGLAKGQMEKLKKTKYGMRYGQASLATSMTRVKHAALLYLGPHWFGYQADQAWFNL
ncbi:mediator of RNA polymerase II transcription subunit 33a-like protein [Trifolium pratense]|uniref:Mediator of RNA polymerase II transcription subunit 33a-like protein n=1 Tax=Trifolium pratense TaxID=57577 RepID=A0A2K3NE21_TRIPR|nr:mediator of RNA polymerase II transcription subunit 33a-like protein [Trifolium pratense]